jgi:hypothetical protein
MRMLRKARHRLAVIHAPTVFTLEVLSQAATGERRVRAEHLVAGGIRVHVMHAEEKRIGGNPGEAERHGLDHVVGVFALRSVRHAPIRSAKSRNRYGPTWISTRVSRFSLDRVHDDRYLPPTLTQESILNPASHRTCDGMQSSFDEGGT